MDTLMSMKITRKLNGTLYAELAIEWIISILTNSCGDGEILKIKYEVNQFY